MVTNSQRIEEERQVFCKTDELFDQIINSDDVELETVRIIVLVDCYGVYISIFEFLNLLRKTHKLTEKTVDLAAIAAISWSQFIKLATELSRREQLAKLAEIKASDKNGTILEQELWGQCKKIIEGNADEEDLRPVRKVIGVEFVYEWFFAPFPKAALIKGLIILSRISKTLIFAREILSESSVCGHFGLMHKSHE